MYCIISATYAMHEYDGHLFLYNIKIFENYSIGIIASRATKEMPIWLKSISWEASIQNENKLA